LDSPGGGGGGARRRRKKDVEESDELALYLLRFFVLGKFGLSMYGSFFLPQTLV
jgi:hypothetical protein